MSEVGGQNPKGIYDRQIKSHGGSGRIKADRIVEGHTRSNKATPLSIIDHKNIYGKIDKRSFYDEKGKLYFEIHTNDHNFPKTHPYGRNGEHTHRIEWIDGKMKWSSSQELTSTQRKDNIDIL